MSGEASCLATRRRSGREIGRSAGAPKPVAMARRAGSTPCRLPLPAESTRSRMPGGHAGRLDCSHVCRTVCRRCARTDAALRADEKYGTDARGADAIPEPAVGLLLRAGAYADRRISRSMKPCGFRNSLSASVFILHRRCSIVFSLFFSFFFILLQISDGGTVLF